MKKTLTEEEEAPKKTMKPSKKGKPVKAEKISLFIEFNEFNKFNEFKTFNKHPDLVDLLADTIAKHVDNLHMDRVSQARRITAQEPGQANSLSKQR